MYPPMDEEADLLSASPVLERFWTANTLGPP
jgi:hypothetical protein